MTAVLNVENLSVALGGRRVVHQASLSVSGGEVVGLIGPNGAGKTTLLRTALGMLRPVAGQVTVNGRPVGGGRASIGYVPQRHEFAWDYPISVEGVVMTGRTGALGVMRRPGVADWRAVGEALERVQMTELRGRPVGELSGGQRQRVLVARALALEPALLLLDEPFTGLDMPTQDMLSALLSSLAREGRAVLVTTHDLISAFHGCDRLVLLNETVVAQGTPSRLASDPAIWTRAFGVGDDSPLMRVLEAVA